MCVILPRKVEEVHLIILNFMKIYDIITTYKKIFVEIFQKGGRIWLINRQTLSDHSE